MEKLTDLTGGDFATSSHVNVSGAVKVPRDVRKGSKKFLCQPLSRKPAS